MMRFAWLLVLLAVPASAQTIADQARALIAAKRAAVQAEAQAQALDRAAQAARGAAGKARAQAAAVAARVRSAEADIAAAEARVRIVDARRAEQRARLARGRAPLVRLTAALQTLARRPPGFALIQPGSIDDVVHVRALLAAGVPVVAARTAILRDEMAQAEVLAQQASAAAATLKAGQARLVTERAALARLAAGHVTRSIELADSAMTESDRATALGEKARDIVDLMQELGEQAEVRDRLRTLAGPSLRPIVPGESVASAAPPPAPPGYRLPATGRVVAGLGEIASSGVRAKGITLVPAAGAAIVAPAAGRVAYAGPFRGYKRIVILDHGDGWTTLIAGLATSFARVGDRLAAGASLGRAPAVDPRVTIELRHRDRPVDIARIVT